MTHHNLKRLTERDRYHINDWVLKKGRPYQWTSADYNLSQKGMEQIEPMPINGKLLFRNKFHRFVPSDSYEPFDGTYGFWIIDESGKGIEVIIMLDKNIAFVDNVKLPNKIRYVNELQTLMHALGFHDYAERFQVNWYDEFK